MVKQTENVILDFFFIFFQLSNFFSHRKFSTKVGNTYFQQTNTGRRLISPVTACPLGKIQTHAPMGSRNMEGPISQMYGAETPCPIHILSGMGNS